MYPHQREQQPAQTQASNYSSSNSDNYYADRTYASFSAHDDEQPLLEPLPRDMHGQRLRGNQ
jgi:hypothetical protein